MPNTTELVPAATTLHEKPEQKVVEGQISVVLSVTATGRPEEAEALAEATLRATRILVPGLPVVGK